jgi:hypothetical protein
MLAKIKKPTTIVAILLLALMLTGIAFAMWDKTIHLYGTVDTGEVNLISTSVADDDTGIDPGKDKDVADTTGWVDAVDPQIVHILITNGYPCYYVYVHITVLNTGTVPVKLQDIIHTSVPSELTVEASDSIGEQLDPGDRRDYTVYIHIEQPAAELATYYFTVELWFVQWNEYID